MSSNVQRAFAILELISAKTGDMHLQEISDELGLPPSATHRHLAELVEMEYVRPGVRPGAYVATTKLVSLGFAILSQHGIVDFAQPLLDKLATLSGELVRLAVRDGDSLTFVARAQGARGGLVYDGDMGQAPILFASATGMAWCSRETDEEAVRLIVKQGMGPPRDIGPGTPRTMKEVLARIAAARIAGYGMVVDSANPGTSAVCVPVCDKSGAVFGTISIAGPSVRFTPARMQSLVGPMKEAANALMGARLGSPALVQRGTWVLADDPRNLAATAPTPPVKSAKRKATRVRS